MHYTLYKCLTGILFILSTGLNAQMSVPLAMQDTYKAWQQHRLAPPQILIRAPQAQVRHYQNWNKQRKASLVGKKVFQQQITSAQVLAYKKYVEKRKERREALKQKRSEKKAERQANRESNKEARKAKGNEAKKARKAKRKEHKANHQEKREERKSKRQKRQDNSSDSAE